jgi:hypothetical protein
MRTTLLVLLIALVPACDSSKIAPHLSTDITLKRTNPTTVLIKVHVKNLGDRGTVPIDVEVSTAPRHPVIHPAPFVLNGHEVRDIETSLTASTGVSATLNVKEAERGLPVANKTATIE